MHAKQLAQDPHVRVAALTLSCFLLGSTGWLAWLYHLTGLADPASVDVLTMVVGYLMQALGIGAFSLAQRTGNADSLRRAVASSLMAYVACLAPAVLAPDLATTLAFGYLANVLCGFYQGSYLLALAQCVDEGSRGLVFGGAYAASTLASWLISSVGGGILSSGLTGVMVCVAIATCALLMQRQSPKAHRSKQKPSSTPQPRQDAAAERNLLVLASVTVVLMSLVKNAGFGFPTTDILDGVNLELSRLVYGVGLLAAGFVGDKNRRYGMLCCGAALVTPFLMLSLSGAAAPATLMWALNYLLFGFFSVFRVLVFADMAAATHAYALAGLGLLLGRVGDALGTLLYVLLAGNTLALIAATAALFAGTIMLLLALSQRLYAPVVEVAPTEEELLGRFAARHDLSLREREVLEHVLARHSNAEIAGKLFVSEATVKFHVRNLLRKTGCKSRRELVDLYTTSKG